MSGCVWCGGGADGSHLVGWVGVAGVPDVVCVECWHRELEGDGVAVCGQCGETVGA